MKLTAIERFLPFPIGPYSGALPTMGHTWVRVPHFPRKNIDELSWYKTKIQMDTLRKQLKSFIGSHLKEFASSIPVSYFILKEILQLFTVSILSLGIIGLIVAAVRIWKKQTL